MRFAESYSSINEKRIIRSPDILESGLRGRVGDFIETADDEVPERVARVQIGLRINLQLLHIKLAFLDNRVFLLLFCYRNRMRSIGFRVFCDDVFNMLDPLGDVPECLDDMLMVLILEPFFSKPIWNGHESGSLLHI